MASEKVATNLADWEVIHISTGHEGGAGLAARRLNSALNAKQINSKFVALEHLEIRSFASSEISGKNW